MVVLSSRTLEIIVISGENVRVTEDAYVVVRAESLNCCTTKMAKDSRSNDSSFLSWNEKFVLNMPMHARSITFEVQSNRFKGVRPLGVARIAVSDFLGGAVPENCLQVLSYRLRDWEGKRNGIIRFAVRVAAPEECSVEPAKMVADGKHYSGNSVTSDNNSNEVVVGVPFWWNYPNII